MARGGARVGAGRPRKPDSLRSIAAAKRALKATPKTKTVKKSAPAKPPKTKPEAPAVLDEIEPLAYMLKVMNDPGIDPSRRDRMAVAAAPYLHPKVGESGKKVKTQQAAKAAGTGKFAPAEPPKLVVSNR